MAKSFNLLLLLLLLVSSILKREAIRLLDRNIMNVKFEYFSVSVETISLNIST
jgi:hypothetical protein